MIHSPIRGLVAIVAITLAMLPAGAARACTCTGDIHFEEAFARAEGAFRGVVIDIRPAEVEHGDYILATIEVNACWKGPVTLPTTDVLTAASEASCGYPFSLGTEHLVYADRYPSAPGFFTHLCARSHTTHSGDPDLELLGPPKTSPVEPANWGRVKALYR